MTISKKPKSILSKMFFSAFLTTTVIEFTAVGAGLIDGLITTRMLGTVAMAAEGIVYPYYSIVGIISGLLAGGMQIIAGNQLSRGKREEMQKMFSMVTLIATIISVLFVIAFFAKADFIVMLLGARGNVVELQPGAADYLRGLASGTLPLILCVILSSALQMDSASNLVRIAAAGGMVADIVLDVIAVKMGWGLFGMGLASSVSYYVNLGILFLHFLKKNRMVHFKFKNLPWASLSEIMTLGSDKLAKRLANTLRPIILNMLIISAGGALGMSALSIRNTIATFFEIPISGIAGATALLIGIAYGEKNKEECIQIAKLAHRYTYVCSVVICVLMALSARFLAAYYVKDEGELRQLVILAMYMFGIQSFFRSLVFNRMAYLQSIFRVKESFALTMFSRLLAVTTCAALLVKPLGSKGVILSFAIGDAMICIGILFYHLLLNKGRLSNIEDYLMLPKEFDVPPQDIIEVTIKDEEEVALSAHQLQAFCKGHKYDKKTAMYASLYLEEATLNIIHHGFAQVKNPSPIDVRILIVNGELIIRIRDYCPAFDLPKRIALVQDDVDPDKHLGIKLISATGKKIEYVNLLDTNTLILTI